VTTDSRFADQVEADDAVEALVGAAGHRPAVQRELDRLRRWMRRVDPFNDCFYSHRSPFT
jgi:hypothetical protein